MKTQNTFFIVVSLLLLCLGIPKTLNAQSPKSTFVYGDALPDAPELSARGDYTVGVRTLQFVNKGQVDILNSKEGKDPLYDRSLTVEVWYPTTETNEELITYDEVMGTAGDPNRPVIPFTFHGRAKRDAAPVTDNGSFPLVVVSHGYVGSRYIMTYLTENLASKGYIVVAIDHTESTFKDAAPFQSTLLNRPKDILFVVNEMAESKHFLSKTLDAKHTAVIGYSMGGYGVLNVAGAAYSEFAINFFKGMTGGSNALATRGMQSEEFKKSHDARIKAVVAFAPWGMERGVWDTETLKGLKVPTLFVAGSQDDVSGYEKGIKAIYEGAVNADRYLLTYVNARHNVAPNPPPPESLEPGLHFDEYYRYAEPSWDQRRINNINQHFVTAFLGVHLKEKPYGKFLDINEDSNKEIWPGFVPRSSTGLELLHAEPEQ
ncbi:alpha/beta hydrolase family protein [Flagellimonas sp.]|uniref:alpha/beta hydrolase family protein n=1 Tax=Flagellimonas sp. TaxID=2058762 RepID=UPI003B599C71